MKKIIYLILSALFLCNTYNIHAQKEYYNWIFGKNFYLSFNNQDTSAQFITYYPYTGNEGVSSISDKDGNFLFFTTGYRLFGEEIGGSSGSAQSAFIVKQPGNDNLYYVFTTMAKEQFDVYSYANFSYAIVDRYAGRDSSCAVIQPEVKLFSPTTERIAATRHSNEEDIWILGYVWKENAFRVYLLDKDGLNLNRIVKLGNSRPNTPDDMKGYMKIAPNGKRIALLRQGSGCVEIYDFDNTSGAIYNMKEVCGQLDIGVYGAEFSPDCSKLYISSLPKCVRGHLYQMNIDTYDVDEMIESIWDFSDEETELYGALQLGPDGKIYVIRDQREYLGVINNPNLPKEKCNYVPDGIYLGKKTTGLGLPGMISYGFDFHLLTQSITICDGETINLRCAHNLEQDSSFRYESIRWEGPNEFESEEMNPEIPDAGKEMSGWYKVTMNTIVNEFSDSLYVKVNSFDAVIECEGSPEICKYDSIELLAAPYNKNFSYKWSTGAESPSIFAGKEGIYTVAVTDTNGCTQEAQIEVKASEDIKVELIAPEFICPGGEAEIIVLASGSDNKFEWSNGATNKSLLVYEPGTYSVRVENIAGCEGFAEITLDYPPDPGLEIIGDNIFCRGDSGIIAANGNFESYLWSTGETSREIAVGKPGVYYLEVSDTNGCKYLDSIECRFLPDPELEIEAPDYICEESEATLKPNKEFASYLWSTGANTKDIIINEPGEYTLIISDGNGCKDTASVLVGEYPRPEIDIHGTDILCRDEAIILTADSGFTDYRWSNGDTSRIATIDEPGRYFLLAKGPNGCNAKDSIDIVLFTPDPLLFNKDALDFGNVMIDTSDIRYLIITNNSDYNLTVNVYFEESAPNFEILDWDGPKEIKYGSNELVKMSFDPHALKNYKHNLIVEVIHPCSVKYDIPLNGTGKVLMRVYIPEIRANIRTDISIPLFAKLETGQNISSSSNFSADILINAQALMPINDAGVVTGGLRLLKLNGENITISSAPIQLGSISGSVLLSDEKETGLIIDAFSWNDEFVECILDDGLLIIDSVCVEFLRGVELTEPTILELGPNPADDELRVYVKSDEYGDFRLTIYDIQGREIKTYSWFSDSDDLREFILNANNFPPGLYRAVLNTPWSSRSKSVIVTQ